MGNGDFKLDEWFKKLYVVVQEVVMSDGALDLCRIIYKQRLQPAADSVTGGSGSLDLSHAKGRRWAGLAVVRLQERNVL